ncbi:DUF11 domain-containing protein [Erythrobacter sp. THAF29]|uniref:DUF11 domain-containing protein n=1 Tax=Erythrobacter sp. THAF29 TaxID=2587851 RepID=UPI001269353E|nr:DUF11 domain-containing protein [Erythrobacter sp. THAF29]QFT77596.1 hypothetical protein FIU90_08600 [Erythrobacter sp. THAF29]
MKTSTQMLGAVSSIALIAMTSAPAMAQGTTAGDSITNNVTVTYQVGGVDQTAVTDSDTFTVDRKIDVNVNFTGATPVSVSPNEQNAVLAFDITNLSNAVVDLDLTATLTAGAAANISNIEIYLDSDGDGVLSGAELSAGPITFLDEVAADDGTGTETISVLVVSDISIDAVDTDSFDVALVADAHESGSVGSLGAEITATAGANTAGVDTVLADGNGGTGEEADNDGAFSDEGTYLVSGANVSVVKSSLIISDPVNNTTNPKAIPGAVIQYCIAVSNASGATATGVNVVDDLPFDVTYDSTFGIFVDGTATVDTSGATPVATCALDGSDGVVSGDASFSSGTGDLGEDQVIGDLSDIAAGATRSLYFRVTIN